MVHRIGERRDSRHRARKSSLRERGNGPNWLMLRWTLGLGIGLNTRSNRLHSCSLEWFSFRSLPLVALVVWFVPGAAEMVENLVMNLLVTLTG